MADDELLSQAEMEALLASPPELELEKPAEASFTVRPEIEEESLQTFTSTEESIQQSAEVDTSATKKQGKSAKNGEQRLAAIEEELKVLKSDILP